MKFFSKKTKRKESLKKILELIKPSRDVHDVKIIYEDAKKKIKAHNLDNNVVCILKEPEGFLKIEIKNLQLAIEEAIVFDVYYREIIFERNKITSHITINIEISHKRRILKEREDIFGYGKVFKFIKNEISCRLFFTDSGITEGTKIELTDNKIEAMIFDLCKNRHRLSFLGKNEVGSLGLEIPESLSFQFDHNQKIDKKGRHPEQHKKLFLELKKRAIENGDKVSENIFTREIIECERKILAKKSLYISFSDRFILYIEKYISNYGFSWLRPLLWLFAVNGIFAAIVKYYIPCSQLEYFNIFWNFFDPFFNVAQINETCAKNTEIAVVKVLQKTIFAFLSYETIKAFRRFSKK